jgi:hypothetical protein
MKNEKERWMNQVTIRVMPEDYKRMKHLCIDKDMTMRDILLSGLTKLEGLKQNVKIKKQ